MINFPNYFPFPENFTMGSPILDTTLEEIFLQNQLNQLFNDQSQPSMKQLESKSDNNNESSLDSKIMAIYDKMASLYKKQEDDFLWNVEGIPWDKNCVVKIQQGNMPYVENFFKMQFSSTENLSGRMDLLVKDLVKGVANIDSSLIPSDMINNVSSLIKKNLDQQLTQSNKVSNEVELIASFIALDRTKSMGPLSLSKGATLSNHLIKKASRLYVITECQLGGIFFALRTKMSGSGDNSSFNCKSIHVISKGTISTIDRDDLDASYDHWKKSLLDCPDSGYPISCKVKKLEEIIK